MSKRTWVCVDCGKSYRREQGVGAAVKCPICGQSCEYVEWKIHIPSPRNRKEWARFWDAYRREKRLSDQFHRDPSIKDLYLPLLNRHMRRD